MRDRSLLQFPHETKMMPCGEKIHGDSSGDQRSAEPQRQSVRLGCGSVLDELELLQEEPEPGDHETEAHQGETGTNPCKKSPLCRQRIA